MEAHKFHFPRATDPEGRARCLARVAKTLFPGLALPIAIGNAVALVERAEKRAQAVGSRAELIRVPGVAPVRVVFKSF